MTARYLILVKHSLPQILEDVPARDWTLSDEGWERASILAEKLNVYRPEIIVSSMEPKARETASTLAKYLGSEYQVVEDLHEHDRSSSPHYSNDEFQKLVREFFERPSGLVFGSETADQALQRFRQAVNSILDSYEDKKIVVVAHGTVISLFVAWLTGYAGYELWKELGLPSFVVLDIQSRMLIKTENLHQGASDGLH